MIIIPVDTKVHQETLVDLINKQAATNRKKKKEKWPENLARAFNAKSDRLEIITWTDSYDHKNRRKKTVHKSLPTSSPRVLIPIRSMVKEAIDFKRPSALYCVLPMSANMEVGAPAFYQMSTRVCSSYDNKLDPIVRIWLDTGVKMFVTSFTSLLMHEVFAYSVLQKKKLKALDEKPRYVLNREHFNHIRKEVKNADVKSSNRRKDTTARHGMW